MKHLVLLLLLVAACKPVTVFPIDDDEDGGDAGPEASTPANDAAAPSDAGGDG
jgi:hypothetical protein